jgi:hypothetical protein
MKPVESSSRLLFFYTAPTELHCRALPATDGINAIPTETATLRVSSSTAPEFEMGCSFTFMGHMGHMGHMPFEQA